MICGQKYWDIFYPGGTFIISYYLRPFCFSIHIWLLFKNCHYLQQKRGRKSFTFPILTSVLLEKPCIYQCRGENATCICTKTVTNIEKNHRHTDGDDREVSSMRFNIGPFGVSLYIVVGVRMEK